MSPLRAAKTLCASLPIGRKPGISARMTGCSRQPDDDPVSFRSQAIITRDHSAGRSTLEVLRDERCLAPVSFRMYHARNRPKESYDGRPAADHGRDAFLQPAEVPGAGGIVGPEPGLPGS